MGIMDAYAVAKLREEMAALGHDLSPYTDDQILAAMAEFVPTYKRLGMSAATAPVVIGALMAGSRVTGGPDLTRDFDKRGRLGSTTARPMRAQCCVRMGDSTPATAPWQWPVCIWQSTAKR